jgi:phosphoribosyl 1,2-cyclic phosphodiesterase
VEYCILGSGSGGNATYVAAGNTKVLIDAGITARQIRVRLAEVGVDAGELDAVVVTHEHGDHISGLRVSEKQYGVRVHCLASTAQRLDITKPTAPIIPGEEFTIGDLTFLPFPVPHDVPAVGFHIRNGEACMGYATDVGIVTTLMEERLRNVDALVIESNHDVFMLANGPYPAMLKQRISGRGGHLSNAETAKLIGRIRSNRLQRITLAHLSEENNNKRKACATVAGALEGWQGELSAAYQRKPTELFQVAGGPVVVEEQAHLFETQVG